MVKTYDERYFKRWYRSRSRVVSAAERSRRVQMVVANVEFVLGRALRSVLDIGCGEAPWQPAIKRLRSNATYLGIDSSEYAVRRFGLRRNIVQGSFADVKTVIPEREFDLVVASDVIHYVMKTELESGIAALSARVGGLAYLDFFTTRDEVEGDLREMKMRSPEYYMRLFRKHNLHPLGLQLYAHSRTLKRLTAMEAGGNMLSSSDKSLQITRRSRL